MKLKTKILILIFTIISIISIGEARTKKFETWSSDLPNQDLSADPTGTGELRVSGNTRIETEGELRLEDLIGGEFIGLKSPATITTSQTYTLPGQDGAAGELLSTDGAGNLSFIADLFSFIAGNDNRLVRTDNVGTDELQESGIIINDSDQVSGVDQLNIETEGELRLEDLAGGQFIGLKSPATITSSQTYVLPGQDGTGGQLMSTDGIGNLSFIDDLFSFIASNDNRLLRTDNVGTDEIQESGITINDSDQIDEVAQINIITEGELRFEDAVGGDFVGFKAKTTITSSQTYILPGDDGTPGQVLSTDGSANLDWTNNMAFAFVASNDNRLLRTDTVGGDEVQESGITVDDSDAIKDVTQLDLITEGELRLQDAAGGEFVGFKAPATVSASQTYTFPIEDGVSGQLLKTDGSGTLTWDEASNSSRTETATYTAAITDDTAYLDTSGGVLTVNLPDATLAGATGKELTFIKITSDENLITLDPFGAQTANDNSTTTMSTQWEVLVMRIDGSNWVIKSRKSSTAKTAFTPTGSWVTATTYSGFKWRSQDRECYDVKIATSGAVTAATLTIDIPNSKTIDAAKIAADPIIHVALGISALRDTGTATKLGRMTYSSTTAVQASFLIDGTNNFDAVNQAAPFTWASGDTAYFHYCVPITDWKGDDV